MNYGVLTPKEARELIRGGKLVRPTSGIAKGHVQANLAILPKDLAFDFLLFANRNKKPCPILDVIEPGSFEPKLIAKGCDIRTDIPKYRIYKHGELVEEVDNLLDIYRDDFVAFLIGCSFSFENAMLAAGIPVRHIEDDHNVPMFITNIPTVPAGPFHGNMVVSMRPIPYDQVVKATTVTARYPAVHGAPVHIGDPGQIGIKDVMAPDFGEPSVFKDGEVPVFWACGVTPQSIAMTSKPEIMITHAPGYMLICDPVDEDYAV
ncbi:putative hydro-lyase [Peptoniphilus equinus]|uniref:Putative hydro-lyase O6R05_07670 n=1 Tax=Peptoniphilus equinus TaxID=3016343 RepID=A0ABY7QV10_9FIRM|nr:putative hydro-lyase [Peptoniphilus equinus]WBW49870.1 putative hydro-lyase [Peptoniphilus equinus]